MKYIYNMAKEFADREYARFFMPGHKGKTGYSLDLTEADDLDDLACPSGAIKMANERIARLYGYDYATMVTSGSTVCIHAMLLCSRGKVLLGRDAHKSAINGLYLYNISSQVVEGTCTGDWLNAIENTDAKTIYITYPNYYGGGTDIKAVVQKAKQKNMLVIADCAHGAHFICEERLPLLPDADILCTSVHKTLGALTGGGAVMCKDKFKDELFENLWRVHSTSPSYLIMESIDSTYDFVENNPQLMKQWVDKCIEVKARLKDKVEILPCDDITRFVVWAKGYTGYELYDLYKEKGVIAEMADMQYVVFLTSPYDIDSIDTLLDIEVEKREQVDFDLSMPQGKTFEEIRWVKGQKAEAVHYKNASGYVSAKPIGAYPPGTAMVMPGEIITKEVIDYIDRVYKRSGKLFGVDGEYIKGIKCL